MPTLREWIAVFTGASLSFGVALLAGTKHPEHVIRVAFWVCLGLLICMMAAEWWRQPWLSVHLTPLRKTAQGIVLRVGFNNHGRRALGRTMINLLVPDTVGLAECDSGGVLKPNPSALLTTPESVDGKHPSIYWNDVVDLVPGSMLLHLLVTSADPRVPMRGNVSEVRRDATVSAIGDTQVLVFSSKLRSLLRRGAS